MPSTNPNVEWGKVVAASLWSAGIRSVCLSPGSRSTPLVLGLYLFQKIEILVHVDERCAAFFALGMAKAQRSPVALMCTSGSAAAHYYPAVIEAAYSHVPLVILTADRPTDLRYCGAPQTIDQLHLFGHHVQFFAEVGAPIDSPWHYQALATLVQSTVARSIGSGGTAPGPVHLNFAFPEPLVSSSLDNTIPVIPQWLPLATNCQLTTSALEQLQEALVRHRRGVIIVGIADLPPHCLPWVKGLSQKFGYPILAESTGMPRGEVISHYDSFLRSSLVCQYLAPEIVLRIGAMPTSKNLRQWLERYPNCQQILLGHPHNTDSTHGNAWHSAIDVASLGQALLDCKVEVVPDEDWWNRWVQINHLTAQTLNTWMDSIRETFPGKIYYALARWLPPSVGIYIGNSTPIRDLDSFFHADRYLRILSNRGANGIDGMVSASLGAAHALLQPFLLICGDLSFYHDLNGLVAAQRFNLSLTILLIDNQGGGIFEMLPVSQINPPFEELFATPMAIDFAPIVQGYGGKWHEVTHLSQLQSTVLHAIAQPGLQVICVKTDRKRGWQLRQQFWQTVISTTEAWVYSQRSQAPK